MWRKLWILGIVLLLPMPAQAFFGDKDDEIRARALINSVLGGCSSTGGTCGLAEFYDDDRDLTQLGTAVVTGLVQLQQAGVDVVKTPRTCEPDDEGCDPGVSVSDLMSQIVTVAGSPTPRRVFFSYNFRSSQGSFAYTPFRGIEISRTGADLDRERALQADAINAVTQQMMRDQQLALEQGDTERAKVIGETLETVVENILKAATGGASAIVPVVAPAATEEGR